ncbi:pantothenate kinase [Streptococcus pneumoniae]|nr:pantothenate kinase [Streptococcus pneumoniae]
MESIKSFNDQISLQDVTDIYLPLAHLIQIYKRTKEDLAFSKCKNSLVICFPLDILSIIP